MIKFNWRSRSDGIIEVDHGDGKGFVVPTLPQFDVGVAKQIARAGQWKSLASDIATANGISVPWCIGVIYAESAGNPNAVSAAGARGLMQIMPSTGKAYGVPNPDDLFLPHINIDCGSRILVEFARKGFDVPRCASMYNAGPSPQTGGPKSSTKSPWGMVEDAGYISRVVAATNFYTTALGYGGGQLVTRPRPSGGLGLPLLALGALFLWKGQRS